MFGFVEEGSGLLVRKYLEGMMSSSPHTIVLVYVLCILVPLLCGYILGSLNSAVIVSRLFFHDDIRKYGSGNGGTTNVMRTYGKGAAVLTLAGDLLKTVLAVFIGYLLVEEEGGYMGGLGAVIGHCFPVFFRFRGGKGVACAAAVILCTEPVLFLILVVLFAAIVAVSKYVSLGSIMCALIYPLFLNRIYQLVHHTPGEPAVPTLVSFLIMFILLIRHWDNIQRLMHGEENKFSFKKSVKRENAAGADEEEK